MLLRNCAYNTRLWVWRLESGRVRTYHLFHAIRLSRSPLDHLQEGLIIFLASLIIHLSLLYSTDGTLMIFLAEIIHIIRSKGGSILIFCVHMSKWINYHTDIDVPIHSQCESALLRAGHYTTSAFYWGCSAYDHVAKRTLGKNTSWQMACFPSKMLTWQST
jgi:hypothetical protein